MASPTAQALRERISAGCNIAWSDDAGRLAHRIETARVAPRRIVLDIERKPPLSDSVIGLVAT